MGSAATTGAIITAQASETIAFETGPFQSICRHPVEVNAGKRVPKPRYKLIAAITHQGSFSSGKTRLLLPKRDAGPSKDGDFRILPPQISYPTFGKAPLLGEANIFLIGIALAKILQPVQNRIASRSSNGDFTSAHETHQSHLSCTKSISQCWPRSALKAKHSVVTGVQTIALFPSLLAMHVGIESCS